MSIPANYFSGQSDINFGRLSPIVRASATLLAGRDNDRRRITKTWQGCLRERPKEISVPGTWTVIPNAFSPIHTFTAPEESWLVTSHIIELPSQLYVVDAQYTLSHAREVARYAVELKKPLTRLYVTHYHPDHLLGAAAFDAPLFALASVARKISEAGDRVAREEHEKIGDDIPLAARRPDTRIEESPEIVDGVRIEHGRQRVAETEDA